jgi:catechol 2,3-dioxygenase-like lactoylglutathione lyase family enzyme
VIEINGVAHVILRINRMAECTAFYDELMPFLGLQTVLHSDQFVYYVGGRTARGIRPVVRAPEEGPWAPGYYSTSFLDPEGIRLEINYVPGKGCWPSRGASAPPPPPLPLLPLPRRQRSPPA